MHAPLLALAALAAAQPALADRVWLEGEAPARTTFAFRTSGWGQTAFLSGGRWLTADLPPADVTTQVPAGGIGAEYDFQAPSAGTYEVWARVGFEFARSPFRWQIDGGAWSAVSPDALTTDLMAVADGAEVAWLRLGTVELTAGPHTLRVNIPPPLTMVGNRAEPTRLLFGLDAIVLSRAPFTPNGSHPPDANWKTALDRLADRTAFEFPAAANDPRRVLDLVGAWHVARFDETEIADRTGPIPEPPANPSQLIWRGIRVPGDVASERPDLAHAHRLLYRARVRVPAALAGRTFVLRLPSTAVLATVFVNGRRCGFSDTPFAPFDCDVTAAVRPGQVNEIVVGIKDAHYAIPDAEGVTTRRRFAVPTERLLAPGGPARFADVPVLGGSVRSGILEAPSLIAAGPPVVADVAVRPSVGQKRLGADVTVRNPTAAALEVEVRAAARSIAPSGAPLGGDPAKTLIAKTVTVPAGQSVTVSLDDTWERPRLWWPDEPHRYVLETTLVVNGRPADAVSTAFGFCEWGWAGSRFTLNGVPWALRADRRHADRRPGRYAEEAARDWRRAGQTFATFAGEVPWTGYSRQDTLEFFDRVGVPVRRAGPLALSPGYAVGPDGRPNPALIDRWRRSLATWVAAERNHPSVFVWSIGLGSPDNQPAWLERELASAADLIRTLDPTRPVVIDRGPLVDTPPPSGGQPEILDLAVAPPPGSIAVAGAAPFARVRGASRRLVEACRWNEVPGFQIDVVSEGDTPWQPVAVVDREATSVLPAGESVTRTLKVFNDTRHGDPITVYWLLQTRGSGKVVQVRGKRTFTLPPGGSEEFAIELAIPPAPGDADLILSCERGGRPVFLDTRRCKIVAK